MPGSVLKAWNPITSQWEVVLVGKQGAPGPTGPTGPAGPGVPTGGATGDLLVKNSGTNYDTTWTDSPTVDRLSVDTTAAETLTAEGQLAWNDTSGTLAMMLKGGVTQCQIGETVFARVRNSTGAPLLRGQAVYLSGSSGQKIQVTLAQANSDTTSSKTFGVVAETIADSSDGFVITTGLLQGFDTNLLTEGQIVWLSPSTAGGLTTTKPVAPDHLVMVGICVKQGSGTSGSIFVKVQNGYELDEIHDVRYTNLATGDVLTRTSANLWENVSRGNLFEDDQNILAVQVFS